MILIYINNIVNTAGNLDVPKQKRPKSTVKALELHLIHTKTLKYQMFESPQG